ncbi:MAG: hypothetical protein ACI4TJ_07285, partial [Candidatus Cryptobacteroides sp.]
NGTPRKRCAGLTSIAANIGSPQTNRRKSRNNLIFRDTDAIFALIDTQKNIYKAIQIPHQFLFVPAAGG